MHVAQSARNVSGPLAVKHAGLGGLLVIHTGVSAQRNRGECNHNVQPFHPNGVHFTAHAVRRIPESATEPLFVPRIHQQFSNHSSFIDLRQEIETASSPPIIRRFVAMRTQNEQSAGHLPRRLLALSTVLVLALSVAIGSGISSASATGNLTDVTISPDNTLAGATNVTWTEQFTVGSTAVVGYITFPGAPNGQNGIGLGAVTGIGDGTASYVPDVGLTYTVTNPQTLYAGNTVSVQFTGVTNGTAGTTPQLTTKTYDSSPQAAALNNSGSGTTNTGNTGCTPADPNSYYVGDGEDQSQTQAGPSGCGTSPDPGTSSSGTTTPTEVDSGDGTLSLHDPAARPYGEAGMSLSVAIATPLSPMVLDPSIAELSDVSSTMTLSVVTNANLGYVISMKDTGMNTAGTGALLYTIPASETVAPAEFAANTFGVSATMTTAGNSQAALASTLSGSTFTGYSSAGSTLMSATKPTGATADTVTLVNRGVVDYTTPAGIYSDTITFTITPRY